MLRGLRRWSFRAAVAATAYVGVVSYTPEDYVPPVLLPARYANESIARMGATGLVFCVVVLDYAISPKLRDLRLYARLGGGDEDSPTMERQFWSQLHRRNAVRCRRIAEANGGLYIKTGQSIASMNNVVPYEYVDELRPLHDRVAARPFDEVEAMVCAAYGVSSVNDVFSEFDREPIASASIAQVHRATFQGTPVAVKVQYPEVSRRFVGDMMTVTGIFRFIRSYVSPKYDFVKMLEEIEEYMRAEFDFEREGRNSDAFRAAMSERFPDGAVVVPRVVWSATRPRVLVSEFFADAVRCDDVIGMQERGIDADAAAKLIVQSMAYALFQKGLVHADPHPGNVLVRRRTRPGSGSADHRNGSPQIAILDFGLMVVLKDDFRKRLAMLYRAAALHDDAVLAEVAPTFGLPTDATPKQLDVLATCTLQEPYNLFSHLSGLSYSSDVEQARWYWEAEGENISQLFERCPKDFTMAITNLDMTRALHQEMRASFCRVLETLPFAQAALAADEMEREAQRLGGSSWMRRRVHASLAMLRRWTNAVTLQVKWWRRHVESAVVAYVTSGPTKSLADQDSTGGHRVCSSRSSPAL